MFRRLTSTQLAIDLVLAVIAVILRATLGVESRVVAFVILGMGIAFALRRISPALALGVAWLFAIIQMLAMMAPDVSNLAILAVLYSTARYGTPRVKWAGLASAIGGAVVATAYAIFVPFAGGLLFGGLSPMTQVAHFVIAGTFSLSAALAVLGLSWTVGLLAKTWTNARDTRLAKAAADQTVIVEQERNRIARDMHDVVAHSLAVVIAQADGARYARATDPAAVDGALTTISTTAREALADVRLLLGQLRHSQDAGPEPVLADLDRLVEQMRASGLAVDLRVSGDPVILPAGKQLAMYRIVQEALTNALRHGDAAAEVTVAIEWGSDAVALTVTNALPNPAPAAGPPGHGLAGMRERALLVGGEFDSAPGDDRYVVHAQIPVGA